MYDLSIVDNTIYGGILMDNNINVLDELNKGCSMGIEAIGLILKKVNNNEFIFEVFKVSALIKKPFLITSKISAKSSC